MMMFEDMIALHPCIVFSDDFSETMIIGIYIYIYLYINVTGMSDLTFSFRALIVQYVQYVSI